MIEVVTSYFEETNLYEKAPSHERQLDRTFPYMMVPPTLPSIGGYTNM